MTSSLPHPPDARGGAPSRFRCGTGRGPVGRRHLGHRPHFSIRVNSMDDVFMTVGEVAQLLKLNPQTVRNWIDRGELPAVRVGARRVRIRQSDFYAFLSSGATEAAVQTATTHAGETADPLGDHWADLGMALAAASRAMAEPDRDGLAESLQSLSRSAERLSKSLQAST